MDNYESYSLRLSSGARRIVRGCRSPLWWSAAKVDSIRECKLNVKSFFEWAKLYDFYSVLYGRAQKARAGLGIGDPDDPLNRSKYPQTSDAALEELRMAPLALVDDSGLAIPIKMFKRRYVLVSRVAYEQHREECLKEGDVITSRELMDLTLLKIEDPDNFDDAWMKFWLAKKHL